MVTCWGFTQKCHESSYIQEALNRNKQAGENLQPLLALACQKGECWWARVISLQGTAFFRNVHSMTNPNTAICLNGKINKSGTVPAIWSLTTWIKVSSHFKILVQVSYYRVKPVHVICLSKPFKTSQISASARTWVWIGWWPCSHLHHALLIWRSSHTLYWHTMACRIFGQNFNQTFLYILPPWNICHDFP